MKIGNKTFKNHTYIMGILNITPDSFSDGGKYADIDKAMRHADQMIKEGADLIDIGGESTRPGYQQISDDEEIEEGDHGNDHNDGNNEITSTLRSSA